jgi:hypothetical protein
MPKKERIWHLERLSKQLKKEIADIKKAGKKKK